MLTTLVSKQPNGVPDLEEGEQIRATFTAVQLFFETGHCEGSGSLFLTNQRLIWINSGIGADFAVDFRSIILHAVSRDVSEFSHEHLLCQIADKLPLHVATAQVVPTAAAPVAGSEEGSDDDEDDSDDYESDEPSFEVRFVPSDPLALSGIFDEMRACSLLNPDDGDDTDEDDEMITEADLARANEWDSKLQVITPAEFTEMVAEDDSEKFADAEEGTEDQAMR
eukprot:TRINITY_DN2142_c0_g2_i1.p1 TRINITY_DN2142_c0_g2~~TRINITY_DN2142_c0_g2_i1.p1  ORF type:complete len:224 (+),score=42.81 TRINITY_DN2142_c0_g2_i1:65-736(+)